MPTQATDQATDANGTVTETRYDPLGRPLRSWIPTDGLGSDTNPNEQYVFADLGAQSVTPPFYISYRLHLGTQAGGNDWTWQSRWFDGRGRTLQDVSPKDGGSLVIVSDTDLPPTSNQTHCMSIHRDSRHRYSAWRTCWASS